MASVDDIEDLILQDRGSGKMTPSRDDEPTKRPAGEDAEDPEPSRVYYNSRSVVLPRSRTTTHVENGDAAKAVQGLVLAETKTVYVRTFGCAHNASDSEFMMGVLASEGYRVTTDESKASAADAWLVNSCTVKDPSQAAFVRVAQDGLQRGKAVVLAGCVPQGDRGVIDKHRLRGASVVGVAQVARVGEAVEAALKGETFSALGLCGGPSASSRLPSLELPKVRRSDLVEIVPLSSGCLGACTYCKTRHARGRLASYPIEAIARRVAGAVEDGVAEVWLSSEDTGAYGLDRGTSIAELLERLLTVFDDKPDCATMLRLGMTNPPYVLAHLEAVAAFLRHPNVFALAHVPVQSGSDAVLLGRDRMDREYTRADFETVVRTLRGVAEGSSSDDDHHQSSYPEDAAALAAMPTIMTDVICGFPGETEADFDQTIELVDSLELATCNVSQFYARPGTPAARMRPRVPTGVVKARSRRLTRLLDAMHPYAALSGATLRCHARDELADGAARLVAHTKNYVKVLVAFDRRLVGAHFDATVTAVHRWHVDAEVQRVVLEADADRRPALAAALERLDHVLVTQRRRPRRDGEQSSCRDASSTTTTTTTVPHAASPPQVATKPERRLESQEETAATAAEEAQKRPWLVVLGMTLGVLGVVLATSGVAFLSASLCGLSFDDLHGALVGPILLAR